MTVIFYVLLIFLIKKHTYAQEFNIDFEVNSHYIQQNEIKKIDFKYDLNDPEYYIVRPVIEDISFEFFNSQDLVWYSNLSHRDRSPNLKESMFLKFPQNNFEEECLKFEIQNKYSFEKFYTPCKSVWGKNIYIDYLSKINQNLGLMLQ